MTSYYRAVQPSQYLILGILCWVYNQLRLTFNYEHPKSNL